MKKNWLKITSAGLAHRTTRSNLFKIKIGLTAKKVHYQTYWLGMRDMFKTQILFILLALIHVVFRVPA